MWLAVLLALVLVVAVYCYLDVSKRMAWIRRHSTASVDVRFCALTPWMPLSMVFPRIPYINFVNMNNFLDVNAEEFAKTGCDTIAVVSLFNTYFATRDSRVMKDSLITNRKVFPKPTTFYEFLNFFGRNIISAEGAEWLNHRKVIQPAFSDEGLRYLASSTMRHCLELSERASANEGRMVNIHEEMKLIALKVICDAGFGFEFNKEDADLFKSVQVISESVLLLYIFPKWMIEKVPVPPLKAFYESLLLFQEYMDKIVSNRTESAWSERKDLLALMLLASDREANKLSKSELIADTFIFLFAGHETTSTALTWALTLLALNPDVQQKVFEEVSSVVGSDRLPDFDDYRKLKYVEAAVKESLRIFSPIPVISKQASESNLSGGAYLDEWIYHAQTHSKNWSDPAEFRPERLLEKGTDGLSPDSTSLDSDVDNTFLPFSRGPRSCVGFRFALIEATLVTAALVQKFHISPNRPTATAEILAVHQDLILKPKNKISLEFVPRH